MLYYYVKYILNGFTDNVYHCYIGCRCMNDIPKEMIARHGFEVEVLEIEEG